MILTDETLALVLAWTACLVTVQTGLLVAAALRSWSGRGADDRTGPPTPPANAAGLVPVAPAIRVPAAPGELLTGSARPDGRVTLALVPDGWQVVAVDPGTPADRAGLRPGDVVERVFHFPVRGPWGEAVRRHLDGPVFAHVRRARDGRVSSLWVDLGAGSGPSWFGAGPVTSA